jgi:uncharacterized protein YijF (DUF1287 family)
MDPRREGEFLGESSAIQKWARKVLVSAVIAELNLASGHFAGFAAWRDLRAAKAELSGTFRLLVVSDGTSEAKLRRGERMPRPQMCSALVLSCFLVGDVFSGGYQSTVASISPEQAFLQRLVSAAEERPNHSVRYDPAYVRIPYPGGDVPANTGVCSDEIIRIYRAVGIDLQKEVHEDMEANFWKYPNHLRWRTLHTDTNIDHRRVPNLMVFFGRKGETLRISTLAIDYAPGDLITWDLGGGVPHIGMVVAKKSGQSNHYLIVHNIGQGPKMEDVLFQWKITGHYRYFGPQFAH